MIVPQRDRLCTGRHPGVWHSGGLESEGALKAEVWVETVAEGGRRFMGGGCTARLSLLFSFPCSADHERDWLPYKLVFSVGNQYAECEKQQQQAAHTFSSTETPRGDGVCETEGPHCKDRMSPQRVGRYETGLRGAGCRPDVVTRSLRTSHIPAFNIFRLPFHGRHNFHSSCLRWFG